MKVTLQPRNDRQNAWLEIAPPLAAANVLHGRATDEVANSTFEGADGRGGAAFKVSVKLKPEKLYPVFPPDRSGEPVSQGQPRGK